MHPFLFGSGSGDDSLNELSHDWEERPGESMSNDESLDEGLCPVIDNSFEKSLAIDDSFSNKLHDCEEHLDVLPSPLLSPLPSCISSSFLLYIKLFINTYFSFNAQSNIYLHVTI